ncbi:MAG: phosphoglycerate kinase [Candidatus Pacebacteria bacterium]|nr:phosphoglycerate kinase [Candidatus Paceibacterota bacterium]
MKSVKSIKNIKGKYVLVRTDFNVPTKGFKVLDKTRIIVALPTINLLRKKGARIILISHIGRKPEESLKPVYKILNKYLPVKFMPSILGEGVEKVVSHMKNGEVLLLENLRSNSAEKEGDLAFAKEIASLADAYVNEAFPVSHRTDASIVGIPKYLPSYAGLQLEREVKQLSKVLKPKRPFLFILGGAKIETKLPIMKQYLKTADNVFIGGVLANNFFKAQGKNIGASKYDAGASSIKSFLNNKKLIIPKTIVVAESGKKSRNISTDEVGDKEMILDIGLPSIEALSPVIAKAKLILWNGPMGYYEGGYTKATELLLNLLAKSKAETIIGGGDTSVLVEKKKMAHKFTFVSTGGGATLDFLAKGTLPGIKALK